MQQNAVSAHRPSIVLGPGDSVQFAVFGQPDMTSPLIVTDDGSLEVPLAGPVLVAGLSPNEAAHRVEQVLVDKHLLKAPQVTITVVKSVSQRASVVGEVTTPGRYPVSADMTIFDVLAEAGGLKETAAQNIILIRSDESGEHRYTLDLIALQVDRSSMPVSSLQANDQIVVPKAPQFYIFGEVTAPNMYRIERNMTFTEAIVRAGGVTLRGSRNRFEVKRKDENGKEYVAKVKSSDLVQPGDVIRVKESIF